MKIMKDNHHITNVMKVVLPEQYQQCEWVENSGDAYINTLYKPTGDTTAEVKARRMGTDTDGSGVFGARTAADTKNYTFVLGGDDYYAFGYNTRPNITSTKWTTTAQRSNSHVFRREKGNMYLDGNSMVTASTASFTCDYNALLFTYNNGGNHSVAKQYRVYYCKIWDGSGTIVRDLYPVYEKADPTNIGFYDIVNGVFYGKQGSGSFSKGSDCAHEISKIYKGTNVIWEK